MSVGPLPLSLFGKLKTAAARAFTCAQNHDALFVFIFVFLVYDLVRSTIPDTGDVIAVTLQALNLFTTGSLAFDHLKGTYITTVFSDGGFMTAPNGHFVNAYPIGMVILTLPLYALFFLFMKLKGISTDLTSMKIWKWRIRWSHMAAMIVAAGTATLFYAACRKVSSRRKSLILTAALAFGTTQWAIAAQTMWQHGGVAFLSAAVIFATISALHSQDTAKTGRFLFLAGLAAGFYPVMRPTAGIFMLASGLFTIAHFKKQCWPYLLGGAVGPALLMAYNWWMMGHPSLMGGYVTQTGLYAFTWYNFIHALPGLLFSPSKGLLIYSPFLLFALPAVRHFWATRAEPESRFIGYMLIACFGLLMNYSFFRAWHGDAAFGPRFLTDALPVLCFSLNYVRFDGWVENALRAGRNGVKEIALALMLLWSIGVQLSCILAGDIGVEWSNVPNYPLGDISYTSRYWDVGDAQFVRAAKAVYYKKTTKVPQTCALSVAGYATPDGAVQPALSLTLDELKRDGIRLAIKNDGAETVFGYRSGLMAGRPEIAYKLLNDGPAIENPFSKFYVERNIKPGANGIALMLPTHTMHPGKYMLQLLPPAMNGTVICGWPDDKPINMPLEIK